MRYLTPVCKKIVDKRNKNTDQFKQEFDKYVLKVFYTFCAYRKNIDYRGLVVDKKV